MACASMNTPPPFPTLARLMSPYQKDATDLVDSRESIGTGSRHAGKRSTDPQPCFNAIFGPRYETVTTRSKKRHIKVISVWRTYLLFCSCGLFRCQLSAGLYVIVCRCCSFFIFFLSSFIIFYYFSSLNDDRHWNVENCDPGRWCRSRLSVDIFSPAHLPHPRSFQIP